MPNGVSRVTSTGKLVPYGTEPTAEAQKAFFEDTSASGPSLLPSTYFVGFVPLSIFLLRALFLRCQPFSHLARSRPPRQPCFSPLSSRRRTCPAPFYRHLCPHHADYTGVADMAKRGDRYLHW